MMPPNERRYFVHRVILGAAASLIPGGGIALSIANSAFNKKQRKAPAAAAKFEVGGRLFAGDARRREITAAMDAAAARGDTAQAAAFRRELGSMGALRGGGAAVDPGFMTTPSIVAGGCPQTATCRWPQRWDTVTCRCKTFLGDVSGPDPDPGGGPIGNGVVTEGGPFHHPPSHFHPVQPMTFTDGSTRDGVRRRCPRRYKLGIDNLCYFNLPRNSKFRKWRPGRKPLFTGGDLNAIATAGKLAESAEDIFKDTNPAKKAVARNYRANWRKPLKK